MTGPGPAAETDLTIRATRPVVDAQVVPGPAGPPGAPAFGVMASGAFTLTFNNALEMEQLVVFPAGRFSAAPQVVATTNHADLRTVVGYAVSDHAQIFVTNRDAGSRYTGSVTVSWFAVQTTGPGQPPAGYPVLATNLFDRPNPSTALPWSVVGTGTVIYNTGDPEVGNYARFTWAAITATTALHRVVNVIPGVTYTLSAYLRNNGPNPRTVRMTLQSAGPFIVLPPDGVWRRYSQTFTPTTAAPQARPVEAWVASGDLSGTVDVARVNVTPGTALFDYFDGDLPGGRWTGAAGNSQSELLGPRIGDIQGIVAARTPLELAGTGMPNNTVPAPVGSYYTDTAATNGAIRWIKETGTGSTGWRVLWGDTGSRTLTPLLINGWTATNVTIRRWGDLVTLWVNGLNPANATDNTFLADLGNGWRQFLNARQPVLAVSGGNPAQIGRIFPGNSTIGFTMARDGLVGLGGFVGCWSWQCAEAWPATLPG